MKQGFLIALICTYYFLAFGQTTKLKQRDKSDTVFLSKLMEKYPQYFKEILLQKDSLNVQIVYTQINRDKNNKASFREFHFNLHDQHYFYPASTVKMPIAFLALEKLQELKIKGLDKNTTMVTDSSYNGQTIAYTQPNSADSRATIENYVKQIFLVSSNDAFNKLYEFLGQEYIQNKLAEKGYPDIIIKHRLDVFLTKEQNKATNPISFYDSTDQIVYQQPAQYSNAIFPTMNVHLGKGYFKNGELVNQPFDFSEKNRVYLQDQHHLLQSVLFPEAFKYKQRFNLNSSDQSLLKKTMSAFPRESDFPFYDTANYHDAYCKFLLYGSEKGTLPTSVRIFNKVGDAYGFLTDIAYLVDFENKVEFLLSATISCNSDGIYNDDKYDYEKIGYPFMKHLGEVFYQYELNRKKKIEPNLSSLLFDYDNKK